MDRHNLMAGFVVLVLSVFLLAGTASAHTNKAHPGLPEEVGCVVNTLPSFVDQGLEAESSSVADVVEVECERAGKRLSYDGEVRISDVELYDRCRKQMSWSPTNEFVTTEGPVTEAKLDEEGNATVVMWAGPECTPGETQIMVDEAGFPNETYMAPFTVLSPKATNEGVFAMPEAKVENFASESAATIIQVEFPGVAEAKVTVNAEQLFLDCVEGARTIWIGPDEKEITRETGRLEGPTALETDDDGNAFVVVLATEECGEHTVDIEASLEETESFNTVNGKFFLEEPRPTI